MEKIKEEVAKEIKRARTYRKLSQKEFAEKLGTKQSVVARWENGKQLPTLKTLTKMADVLNASLTTGFDNINGKKLSTTYFPGQTRG